MSSTIAVRQTLQRLRAGMFRSVQEREALWGVVVNQLDQIDQKLAMSAVPALGMGMGGMGMGMGGMGMGGGGEVSMLTAGMAGMSLAQKPSSGAATGGGRRPGPKAGFKPRGRFQGSHDRKPRGCFQKPHGQKPHGQAQRTFKPRVDTRMMTAEQRHARAAGMKRPTTIYIPDDETCEHLSDGTPYFKVIAANLQSAGWNVGSELRFHAYAKKNAHRNKQVVINTNCQDEFVLNFFREQGCTVNVTFNDNPLAVLVREGQVSEVDGAMKLGETCGANEAGMPLVFVKGVCVAGCPRLRALYMGKHEAFQKKMLQQTCVVETAQPPTPTHGSTPNYGNGSTTPPYFEPVSPVEDEEDAPQLVIAEDAKEGQSSLSGESVDDCDEEEWTPVLGQKLSFKGKVGCITEIGETSITMTTDAGERVVISEEEMDEIDCDVE
jgi:hypothetical protein